MAARGARTHEKTHFVMAITSLGIS